MVGQHTHDASGVHHHHAAGDLTEDAVLTARRRLARDYPRWLFSRLWLAVSAATTAVAGGGLAFGLLHENGCRAVLPAENRDRLCKQPLYALMGFNIAGLSLIATLGRTTLVTHHHRTSTAASGSGGAAVRASAVTSLGMLLGALSLLAADELAAAVYFLRWALDETAKVDAANAAAAAAVAQNSGRGGGGGGVTVEAALWTSNTYGYFAMLCFLTFFLWAALLAVGIAYHGSVFPDSGDGDVGGGVPRGVVARGANPTGGSGSGGGAGRGEGAKQQQRQRRRQPGFGKLPPAVAAAIAAENLGAIQRWLSGDAHLEDTEPEKHQTALLLAARQGAENAVELLLSVGANVDALMSGGATALYVTAQEGKLRCAKLLLRAGAKLEARTATGATPLFIAARQNHTEVVSLLLKAGADAEAALPATGATALMIGAHQVRSLSFVLFRPIAALLCFSVFAWHLFSVCFTILLQPHHRTRGTSPCARPSSRVAHRRRRR